MESTTLACGYRPIQGVPEQLVPKVVLPGTDGRIQHVVIDQLLDRVVK